MTPVVPEMACKDSAASLAFYVDILGFTVRYARENDGFAYLEREGAEIMIEQAVALKAPAPFGHGMHLQIALADVDSLYQTCKKHGVTILRDLEEAWYRADEMFSGQRQFVVADPDGYPLRFAQDLGRASEPPKTGRFVS